MGGESPYSRDEAVSAITSFYEYLTSFPGLLPSAIQYPPLGGWPEINSDTMAPLEKNQVVIDLLRHLPYLDSNSAGTVEIAFQTIAINFNRLAERKPKDFAIGGRLEGVYIPVDCGDLPEHVVTLTKGRRYGSWLLLDTKEGEFREMPRSDKRLHSFQDVIYEADDLGTVTDYIMMERPERDEPPLGDPDHWRAYQTLPIKEFFELWKEKYRSLEWVVLPDKGTEDGVYIQLRKEVDEIRDIYRAHGWPDAFHYQECKDALLKLEEKRRQAILDGC